MTVFQNIPTKIYWEKILPTSEVKKDAPQVEAQLKKKNTLFIQRSYVFFILSEAKPDGEQEGRNICERK